jgi:hypothetical protein
MKYIYTRVRGAGAGALQALAAREVDEVQAAHLPSTHTHTHTGQTVLK